MTSPEWVCGRIAPRPDRFNHVWANGVVFAVGGRGDAAGGVIQAPTLDDLVCRREEKNSDHTPHSIPQHISPLETCGTRQSNVRNENARHSGTVLGKRH